MQSGLHMRSSETLHTTQASGSSLGTLHPRLARLHGCHPSVLLLPPQQASPGSLSGAQRLC